VVLEERITRDGRTIHSERGHAVGDRFLRLWQDVRSVARNPTNVVRCGSGAPRRYSSTVMSKPYPGLLVSVRRPISPMVDSAFARDRSLGSTTGG
jgi:hypothetical protein